MPYVSFPSSFRPLPPPLPLATRMALDASRFLNSYTEKRARSRTNRRYAIPSPRLSLYSIQRVPEITTLGPRTPLGSATRTNNGVLARDARSGRSPPFLTTDDGKFGRSACPRITNSASFLPATYRRNFDNSRAGFPSPLLLPSPPLRNIKN